MSKPLGDYIHLHYTHYKDCGTYRLGEGKKDKYQIYENFLKDRTKDLTTISDETISMLRKRIANDAKTKAERGIEQKQYDERLEQVYQYIQQFTSDKLIQSFQFGQNQKGFKNQFVSKNYEKGTITPDQLKDKVEKLREIRDMIKELNSGKISATENNIKKLNNKYNELDIGIPLDASISSPIERIQKAIDGYSFDQIYSSVSGRFGEELVFSVRDTAFGIVNDNLQTAINQEAVVGMEKTKISLNQDLFAVKDMTKKIFKSADKNNNQYIINETQDKVDVQIIVNREDVFSSVKDYFDTSGKNRVTLQQDMNLLYSLTFLNSYREEFGNHWINLHTVAEKNKNRKNADKVLKQELAYEALVSGNPFKSGATPANTFIVIDRATGKVIIENTQDILLHKFDQIRMDDNQIYNLNLQKQNKKASNFEERITRILSYLHQIKLHVSYKTNIENI